MSPCPISTTITITPRAPLYLIGYCHYAVFKKIKCKNCISERRDNVQEIPEIFFFHGINRSSRLNKLISNCNVIKLQILVYIIKVVICKLIKISSFSKSKEIRHAHNVECFE